MKKDETQRCDICINVYGKYYQTMLTVKSLLANDAAGIDKIFLIIEKKQPEVFNIQKFKDETKYPNIEFFVPRYHLDFEKRKRLSITRKGIKYGEKRWFNTKYNFQKLEVDDQYRYSIRYQYGLEKTDKKHLLIMHNDMMITAPFVEMMMKTIDEGEYLGVGPIGQCWNCPLHYEKICDGERVATVSLEYNEIREIVERNKSPRTRVDNIDKIRPLPMPECRLNEWLAMINVQLYREFVIPNGSIAPLGLMDLDIGTRFYRESVLRGLKFKNMDIANFARHAPFSIKLVGNTSLFDDALYAEQENLAREYLKNF